MRLASEVSLFGLCMLLIFISDVGVFVIGQNCYWKVLGRGLAGLGGRGRWGYLGGRRG